MNKFFCGPLKSSWSPPVVHGSPVGSRRQYREYNIIKGCVRPRPESSSYGGSTLLLFVSTRIVCGGRQRARADYGAVVERLRNNVTENVYEYLFQVAFRIIKFICSPEIRFANNSAWISVLKGLSTYDGVSRERKSNHRKQY